VKADGIHSVIEEAVAGDRVEVIFGHRRRLFRKRLLDLLAEMGFRILATRGTKRHLDAHGIPCEKINKVLEGRPHVVDAITNGEVDIVFNTTEGAKALADSFSIRRSALLYHIPYYTTLAGALAVTEAIKALRSGGLKVAPLQSYVGQGAKKIA